MTTLDTKALRALEAKATAAPWGKTPFEEKNDVCIWTPDGQWLANVGNWANCQLIVEGEDGPDVIPHPELERIETGHDANAEFMVAIRNAAPALLDAAEENAKIKDRLKKYEDAVRYPGTDERHVGASPAVQLVHAQWKREEAEAERDALRAEVAKLQLSASDVEFYGNEQVKALRAENERLREALTPSGATKAAYHGEFGFELLARDGEGVDCHMVPWTTIKEIMAAISKRADLRPTEGEVKP